MRQKPDRSATIVPACTASAAAAAGLALLALGHPALSQTAACFAFGWPFTFTDDEVLQFGQRLAAGLPPVEDTLNRGPPRDDGEPHSR